MPTGVCTICTHTHTPKTQLRSENLLPLGPLSACTQHGIGRVLRAGQATAYRRGGGLNGSLGSSA